MPTTPTAGPLTVTALSDAEGPFFGPRESASGSAAERQWADADTADPAARTADGRWWLRFRSFAVRYGDGPVTLVDAGIGPAHSLAASWASVPGRVLSAGLRVVAAPGHTPGLALAVESRRRQLTPGRTPATSHLGDAFVRTPGRGLT